MDDLQLSPATKKFVEAFLAKPAHALFLTGPVGSGLGTLAVRIAEAVCEDNAHVTHIVPEKNLIAIDRIRQLYEQTKGIAKEAKCIVIDDADAMSDDAQNALLKLLEEPVDNVHFVLTSHKEQVILPTIRSRMQHIEVLPTDQASSKTLLAGYDLSPEKRSQLLFLAAGRPAELVRLATNEEYFSSQASYIQDARAFIQAPAYDRLKIALKHADRESSLMFLSTTARLLSFTLLKQKNVAAADMLNILDDVSDRISRNAHVKTQLMYLVTKLP